MSSEAIIRLTREMAEVRSIPYLPHYGPANIEYPYRTLAQFVISLADRLKAQPSQVPSEPTVLAVIGLPGSGKTMYTKKIGRFLNPYLQQDITEVNWEQDGRKRAKLAGKVTTPLDQPFKQEELKASGEELGAATREHLLRRESVIVEVPGVANALVSHEGLGEEHWLGRELGGRFLRDLLLKQGLLEGLEYELSIAGFLGGPLLRHILVYFRDELSQTRDLGEAGHIAYIYGKIREDRPLRREEYKALGGGANLGQILVMEQAVNKLRDHLRSQGLIEQPNFHHFIFATPEELRAIMGTEELLLSYNYWSYGTVMEHILSTARMPLDRVFLGYNNPAISELNIPDVGALISRIREKRALLTLKEAISRRQRNLPTP